MEIFWTQNPYRQIHPGLTRWDELCAWRHWSLRTELSRPRSPLLQAGWQLCVVPGFRRLHLLYRREAVVMFPTPSCAARVLVMWLWEG